MVNYTRDFCLKQHNEEINDEFVGTVNLFPKLFDKSEKNHNDRDFMNNVHTEISTIMSKKVQAKVTIIQVKYWWKQLLREYRAEEEMRESETKSGSGASATRKKFSLYADMKDMLMYSHTPKESYSNYKSKSSSANDSSSSLSTSSSSNDTLNHSQECYKFSAASNTAGRKQNQYKEALVDIQNSLESGYAALEPQNHGFKESNNVNKQIGVLVNTELQRMGPEKSCKKERKFMII